MNRLIYGCMCMLLGLTMINMQCTMVQEKEKVFISQSMQQIFFDDIMKDLNNISCNGDSALEHLGKIVQFFALRESFSACNQSLTGGPGAAAWIAGLFSIIYPGRGSSPPVSHKSSLSAKPRSSN